MYCMCLRTHISCSYCIIVFTGYLSCTSALACVCVCASRKKRNYRRVFVCKKINGSLHDRHGYDVISVLLDGVGWMINNQN